MANVKRGQNKFVWALSAVVALMLFLALIISLTNLKQRNTLQSDALTISANLNDCAVDPSKLSISSEEQNLFDKINAYRLQNGLNTLEWSYALIKGAKWMSADMLKSANLSHTDSLGRDPSARLINCGYTGYTTLAENIDSGTGDSISTFNAWQHSIPHNANLLNSNVKDVGIALASDPKTNAYY